MANLLSETIDFLAKHNLTLDDVKIFCGNDFQITRENFIELASEINYDSGYGTQIIACDLKLIGNNWWAERYEYDGSEWWEFKTFPTTNLPLQSVHSLCAHYIKQGWKTLAELNKEDDNID